MTSSATLAPMAVVVRHLFAASRHWPPKLGHPEEMCRADRDRHLAGVPNSGRTATASGKAGLPMMGFRLGHLGPGLPSPRRIAIAGRFLFGFRDVIDSFVAHCQTTAGYRRPPA
ncbi:hypothetical protein [Nocardia sp. NPDC052112]|uniref:hypothetical protein n=1 Tax=Nocardia sp. NPDC052112 TaxID=3155646 RepID=UPI0034455C47